MIRDTYLPIVVVLVQSPQFLIQNHILRKKWGCLQKTRVLYLKNDRAMAMSSVEKEN